MLQPREKVGLAALFFVGIGVGYVAYVAVDSRTAANSAAAGVTHKHQSAACYGTSTLCAALLSAHGPKEFQKIADLHPKKEAGSPRQLYALNPVPARSGAAQSVGEKNPSLRSPAIVQGASANAVPTNVARSHSKRVSASQMSVGLYYSTSTGNTEQVAEYIAGLTGIEDYMDIGDAEPDDILAHEAIIVGAPTWHTGADTERSGTSWDEWLYSTLPGMDFTGKKVAIFGVGDSSGYADNFCDATGELYDCFTARGATIMGMTPDQDGIEYEETKSVRDGKFVAKTFDEDGYSDISEERAADWVNQLKGEGFPMNA